MAKPLDFPHEFRSFAKALDSFSGRFYDYDVFNDFIDYIIACMLIHGDQKTADRLKEKYENEYPKFLELYRSLLVCMNESLDSDMDWCDVLGTAYEVIASRSKRSGFGQFFTPKPVCDMMAQITHSEHTADGGAKTGIRVNDPACGSGRTLLAFNKVAPGNKLYADDLDQICTKMAAINLALHGCKGQACNVNSIWPEDWYFGYEINPWQHTFMGLPHLVPIQKEQSLTWFHWKQVELEHAQKAAEPQKPTPKVATPPKEKTEPKHETPTTNLDTSTDEVATGTQLRLF